MFAKNLNSKNDQDSPISRDKIGDFDLCRALKAGDLHKVKSLLQKRPGIHNHLYTDSPICLAIHSGNLELVKYLEQTESVDIFSLFKNGYWIDSEVALKHRLLTAAGASGSIEMTEYLLEDKGLLKECNQTQSGLNYIRTLLGHAVEDKSFHAREVGTEQRLNFLKYLFEEKKLMLPRKQLMSLIRNDAEYSDIRINAYLQRFLFDSEEFYKIYKILTTIIDDGLSKLTIYELFRLHYLNIITKGKTNDFELDLHWEIKKRNISINNLTKLADNNTRFAIEALFYYSTFWHKENLLPLQSLLEIGIDINVENNHGVSLVQHAFREGGYNTIVKFLIEHGANVYKKDKFGKSIYDYLHSKFLTDDEFEAQLKRVAQQKNYTTDNNLSNATGSMQYKKC